MLNVGLVTGSPTPSARAAPRTSVVLPAPSSPRTSTTSPRRSAAASSAPSASVSAGPLGFDGSRRPLTETLEPAQPVERSSHVALRATKMTGPRENGIAGRSLLLEGWRQDLHRQPCQSTLGPWRQIFDVSVDSCSRHDPRFCSRRTDCRLRTELIVQECGNRGARSGEPLEQAQLVGLAGAPGASAPGSALRRPARARRDPAVELRQPASSAGCSGAPSASSSGSRAKSSRSVSSMRGVYSAAAGWKIGYRRTARAPSIEHLGLPVQARDPGRIAAQQLGREVAERADHASAGSARPGAAGTPGSSRSRSAAGRGCRAAGT